MSPLIPAKQRGVGEIILYECPLVWFYASHTKVSGTSCECHTCSFYEYHSNRVISLQ